jgi:ribonucleoside-diphosphate reductase alpha chain
MGQTSGGTEPYFALSYNRRTESLHGERIVYKVDSPIVKWYKDNHDVPKENDELPHYFVTTMDVSVHDRIRTQSVIQQYIDTSISSTINLPNSATIEDVEEVYINGWIYGLKGITVHRQGNKREGILTVGDASEDKDIGMELKRGDWEPEPTDLASTDRDIYTGCGQIKMFIRYSRTNNKIFDFWIKRSGKGGCERSLDDIAVAMSGMLRLGGSINNIKKAFKGIGVCNSFSNARKSGQIVSKGNNCGDSMLRKLLEFKEDVDNDNLDINGHPLEDIDGTPLNKTQKQPQPIKKGTLCPECGGNIAYAGGCIECRTCGYSKCD